MIVSSICLILGVCIIFVMCYIACFKGPIEEEEEDFNELPIRKSTNTRRIETIELRDDLKEGNQKDEKDTISCCTIWYWNEYGLI